MKDIRNYSPPQKKKKSAKGKQVTLKVTVTYRAHPRKEEQDGFHPQVFVSFKDWIYSRVERKGNFQKGVCY